MRKKIRKKVKEARPLESGLREESEYADQMGLINLYKEKKFCFGREKIVYKTRWNK